MLRGIVEHNADGTRQVAEMAHGDIDGLDPIPGPQDSAKGSTLGGQRPPVTACRAGLVVRAEEPGLGAADGGDAQPQAHVAGQADPSGMSDPLPVQQQDVGPLAESLVGRDEGRCFAKAEQAGNVGKTRFSHDARPFHDLLRTGARDHHCPVKPLAPKIVRHVGSADRSHLGQRPRGVDACRKLELEPARLLSVEIPRVQRRNFGHRDVVPLFLGEQVGCVAKTHLHSHRMTKRCLVADSKNENVPALRVRGGPSPAKLLQDLRDLIRSARSGVAQAVNSALVLHNWQVGRRILTDILDSKRAAYGAEIVSTLSRQLSAEFGSGYSRPNLFRMIKFAEFFADGEIVSALSRQLSWSHFIEILRLKDALQRDFYAEMCRIERWNVRTLRAKIGGMLLERTALSRKPEELVKQELAKLREGDTLTPDLVFRDPYFLEQKGGRS